MRTVRHLKMSRYISIKGQVNNIGILYFLPESMAELDVSTKYK
jgi:hypothetical protein